MTNLIKEILGTMVSLLMVLGVAASGASSLGYKEINYDANTIESILIICMFIVFVNLVNKHLNTTNELVDYIERKFKGK